MVWLFSGQCTSDARLDNKTAVITGCNTGIGKATASELCKRGARVIMACRSLERAAAAAEDIKNETAQMKNSGEVIVKELDLTSFRSIRQCAEDILATEKHLHILVNNAGVAFCARELTEDGHELHFGTNHLGHFFFTLLLLPRIIQSAPARIVTVSSLAHAWGDGDMHYDDVTLKNTYSPWRAYARSKLANVLFTKELAKRLKGYGVTTYCVSPGAVSTDITHHMDRSLVYAMMDWLFAWRGLAEIFLKTPLQGAQATLHCCLDEHAGRETGLYYSGCKPRAPDQKSLSVEKAEQLWNYSWDAVGLPKDYEPFVKR